MRRNKLTRRSFVVAAVSSATGIATGTPQVNSVAGPLAKSVSVLSPQVSPGSDLDRELLERLAGALLPAELTAGERSGVIESFLRWHRDYHPDAEMDAGYGFTRLRRTALHPALGYADDIANLRAAAGARFGARLEDLDAGDLRQLLAEVIEQAAPDMQRLPARPDGTHLAVDLLAHYYRSSEATDRCYGMAIRRETCRGLFTDVEALAPIQPPGERAE